MLDPGRQEQSSSEKINSKVIELVSAILLFFLLFGNVTIVFLISVVMDTIILQIIVWLFGNVVAQEGLVGNIFTILKSFSGFGTVVLYMLTLVILLGFYVRYFIRITWETTKDMSASLKSRAPQILRDTAQTLCIIVALTLIFMILVCIIALALIVTRWTLASSFIDAVKVITALAIAIGYVITLVLSLWKYGADLLKIFRED